MGEYNELETKEVDLEKELNDFIEEQRAWLFALKLKKNNISINKLKGD